VNTRGDKLVAPFPIKLFEQGAERFTWPFWRIKITPFAFNLFCLSMVLQIVIPARIEKRLPVYSLTPGCFFVQQLPPGLVFVDFILIGNDYAN
jgi:hypothetical protein